MKLSRVEEDLAQYTQDKLHMVMRDVLQACEIADKRKFAGSLLGAMFLRLAVAIATEQEMSRKKWLTHCGKIYDLMMEE